ncbi:MAG: phosphoribosylamine--glycine ligase [Actinomycetales bacterium]
MKVLVVGSGAREHAIVRALSQDGEVTTLLAAPGNPGIAQLATCLPVAADDPSAVADLARAQGVDLVVVGPEAPLVAGVADACREAGIACFGPSAAAARLEASKAFAKDVMAAAEVPTAMAHLATTPDQVEAALDAFGPPFVVKEDGLAAGKGVVVTDDRQAAVDHALACLAKPDGAVVIEEYLDGPEISLFCITDGTTVVPLAPAQDFKRLQDGDQGPNTGGMGAYSPLPWAPPDLTEQVLDRVARPVITEMARRGTPFSGLLYCGLALTARGLRVVEFNVRFGDPETQVVLARLRTPLGQLLQAAAIGRLDEVEPLRWREEAAVTVVIAAAGYPGTIRTGDPIGGLPQAQALDDVQVLHAGTAAGPSPGSDEVVSAGGRVLSVVGLGSDLRSARATAYAAADLVELSGHQRRDDIAAAVSA